MKTKTDYDTLRRKALGEKGLSANFIGSTNTEKGMSKQKTLNFSVVNKFSTAKKFALHLGSYPDLKAMQKQYSVDAILASGIMATDGTAENPKTLECKVQSDVDLEQLKEYIKVREVVARDVDMISENRSNSLGEVAMVVPNPFEVVPLTAISMRKFRDAAAIDQNRLVMAGINIVLRRDIVVIFSIEADSQIDFAFSLVYPEDQIGSKN